MYEQTTGRPSTSNYFLSAFVISHIIFIKLMETGDNGLVLVCVPGHVDVEIWQGPENVIAPSLLVVADLAVGGASKQGAVKDVNVQVRIRIFCLHSLLNITCPFISLPMLTALDT